MYQELARASGEFAPACRVEKICRRVNVVKNKEVVNEAYTVLFVKYNTSLVDAAIKQMIKLHFTILQKWTSDVHFLRERGWNAVILGLIWYTLR